MPFCNPNVKTLTEQAEKFNIHANQIAEWRTKLLAAAVGVYLTQTIIGNNVGLLFTGTCSKAVPGNSKF